MRSSQLSLASIQRIHQLVSHDDVIALEARLSQLDPKDPVVATELNPRHLVHDAIRARSVLVIEFLTGRMADIDVPDNQGNYPLAVAKAGGEQLTFDFIRAECNIDSSMQDQITPSYPRLHGMKEPGVSNYPIYANDCRMQARNEFKYTEPSGPVIAAVRRELSRVIETPEHPEFLWTQREALKHLFLKYPDINPDYIQQSYQSAFSTEFWSASKVTDVPISDLPLTAIDVCLLRRQYILVRDFVDRGCFSSNLSYPLIAQAIVEREHYILSTLLAAGSDPNTELQVGADGDPLFGYYVIYSLSPDTMAQKSSRSSAMCLLALAAKHKNAFAFRELMKYKPDLRRATANLKRFKIHLNQTMSAAIVAS